MRNITGPFTYQTEYSEEKSMIDTVGTLVLLAIPAFGAFIVIVEDSRVMKERKAAQKA